MLYHLGELMPLLLYDVHLDVFLPMLLNFLVPCNFCVKWFQRFLISLTEQYPTFLNSFYRVCNVLCSISCVPDWDLMMGIWWWWASGLYGLSFVICMTHHLGRLMKFHLTTHAHALVGRKPPLFFFLFLGWFIRCPPSSDAPYQFSCLICHSHSTGIWVMLYEIISFQYATTWEAIVILCFSSCWCLFHHIWVLFVSFVVVQYHVKQKWYFSCDSIHQGRLRFVQSLTLCVCVCIYIIYIYHVNNYYHQLPLMLSTCIAFESFFFVFGR